MVGISNKVCVAVQTEHRLAKYATRAFSSEGVRYCWRSAFSCLEGRPCARCHRVEGGTLLDSDRAAYVLGFQGSRSSVMKGNE